MSASLFPSKHSASAAQIGADKSVGSVPSGSKSRIIRDSHELESVSVGEVIAPLNDYCLLWDEVSFLRLMVCCADIQDCLPPSQLEP